MLFVVWEAQIQVNCAFTHLQSMIKRSDGPTNLYTGVLACINDIYKEWDTFISFSTQGKMRICAFLLD